METNFDSSAVPSLSTVVEEIFSSCTTNGKDVVSVSTLIEFMKPHLSNHSIGLAQLQSVLDPNNENPLINRATFYEAMRKWTARMNESDSKLLGISFRDSDIFGDNGIPFYRSTPKPSLEPTTMKNSNDSLDISNLSPSSFTANMKDNSMGMDKLFFIEERYQELEHKHLNTLKEVSLLKTQLAASEEQYVELKQDLDRTNKRLMLEQQVNADLQKSMEHNDEFKEEVCNTKKEKDYLHRVWLVTKRENVNLLSQIKDLEHEKELLDKKLVEMQRKEEQKKKEFCDIQTLFAIYEDENKLLKKSKLEMEEKLLETKASLEHYIEVSEILKNKIQSLTTAYKKKGIELTDQNVEKEPSPISNSSGTPINSPFLSKVRSSTPLKNIQQSSRYDLFTSPNLQRQLSSPITPGGLDTPKFVKTTLLYNKSGTAKETFNSPGCIKMLQNALYSPKRTLVAKYGRSKNLPSVGSSGEFLDIENKRCFSETAETSLQSENSMFDTMEDLDLSSVSDNLRTFNGQDLLSELQECKFLDNQNRCYIEEHAELIKIVKEHEYCSQIIADKEDEIQSITAEMKAAQNEHNNILNKYQAIKDDIICFEEQLRNLKRENEDLGRQKVIHDIEITELKRNLESKDEELQKMIGLEMRNLHLTKELEDLEIEKKRYIEMYHDIKTEKENLQSNLEKLMDDNRNLLSKNENLSMENRNLKNLVEIKDKDLNELQNLRTQNENLEKEAVSMKLNLQQSCDEVEKLSNKLLMCRTNGKNFIEKVKAKIEEQFSKLECQRESTNKLQEYVNEIESAIEMGRKKLDTLISYVEDNFVNVKYVQKGDDEDSTSTGSSENGNPRSKRRSSSGRKSNFEKQQLRMNKLEEKIEELEKELQIEKSMNENLKRLNKDINNPEIEKINYQEEKSSILRELEAIKHDLSKKDQMLKQFEKKYKFDLDNLNQFYEKEMEVTKITQIEDQKKIESTFLLQIEDLKKKLDDVQKEKELFKSMLEKKEDKIIVLKKALSDISTSTEESKAFETLVLEKESMLNFNREMLLKSNNSLKQAENRCLFLQLLLDKCKMVLLETVNDVLRSTIEVYNSYKCVFEQRSIYNEVLHKLQTLDLYESGVDDFTEKEIWQANDHLVLTAELLKTMVSVSEYSTPKDIPTSKSVSKFTLRPSKLKLNRFPSCDPDISSSSMRDNEVGQCKENEISDEISWVQELRVNENKNSIDNLRGNNSETSWLDPYNDDLSVQITDAPNNSIDTYTEPMELQKCFKTVGVGDSVIDEPSESTSRKRSSFVIVLSVIMCLIAMCILFIHIECVRNGNGTIICPLDFFVSIKKEPAGSSTL